MRDKIKPLIADSHEAKCAYPVITPVLDGKSYFKSSKWQQVKQLMKIPKHPGTSATCTGCTRSGHKDTNTHRLVAVSLVVEHGGSLGSVAPGLHGPQPHLVLWETLQHINKVGLLDFALLKSWTDRLQRWKTFTGQKERKSSREREKRDQNVKQRRQEIPWLGYKWQTFSCSLQPR